MSVIGQDRERPDVRAKVAGQFRYSNDLAAPGMLFAVTVRSPLAHAVVERLDASAALRVPGVVSVLTSHDVRVGEDLLPPGEQPAFAGHVVRFHGEAVALVVAETDRAARLGASLVTADYRPRPALTDPALALAPGAPLVHPGGNLVRHLEIARGPSPSGADVVVTGTWEIGRQDPGFLGLESALAVPDPDGGVTIHTATQDVFMDRRMVAVQLGLDPERVRVQQAGMGGAFGGRERITLQAHVALAALRLGRPVKATYRRPESFAAHAKRHPARVTLTLGAHRDGELVFARGEALLDGGAYGPAASSAVLGATCYYLAGPYRVPTVRITGDAVYTNNPVSGAMRGFGAPQACFAVESAMDLLARELGMNPVELRRRNALRPGDVFPTSGQLVPASAPLADVIDACAALPLPADDCAPAVGLRGRIRRGVGFAVGAKHAMYGEGEPEWSVASVVVDHGGATVRTSAAECGQGLLGVLTQITAETLGGMPVAVPDGSTDDGYAGASSASRQTWMSGSAVRQAAEDAAGQLREQAARYFGTDPAQVQLADGELRAPGQRASLKDVLGAEVIAAKATYHAPPTERGDPVTGAGNVHVCWMFVAHRAVVDVDELGQVAVRQIATAQDVGVALNPREVRGQLIGGTVQGMGLALMEELQTADGVMVNDSFTGYLMPTAVDAPEVLTALVEVAEPRGPFGAKGVGEPPAVSSTPAVAAAIRDATGCALTRVPVRPWDCVPAQPESAQPQAQLGAGSGEAS